MVSDNRAVYVIITIQERAALSYRSSFHGQGLNFFVVAIITLICCYIINYKWWNSSQWPYQITMCAIIFGRSTWNRWNMNSVDWLVCVLRSTFNQVHVRVHPREENQGRWSAEINSRLTAPAPTSQPGPPYVHSIVLCRFHPSSNILYFSMRNQSYHFVML